MAHDIQYMTVGGGCFLALTSTMRIDRGKPVVYIGGEGGGRRGEGGVFHSGNANRLFNPSVKSGFGLVPYFTQSKIDQIYYRRGWGWGAHSLAGEGVGVPVWTRGHCCTLCNMYCAVQCKYDKIQCSFLPARNPRRKKALREWGSTLTSP